jgi:hypothetical protein
VEKSDFFISEVKMGLQVYIGKWKRPSEQVAWRDENIAITTLEMAQELYQVNITISIW